MDWILSGIGTWLISFLTDNGLKYIRNRNKYLKEINKQISNSIHSCLMCINTLDSSTTNNDIEKLQNNLLNKSNNNVEVKVLISIISDSYKGAYEMVSKGINLKFISEDIGEHLNFTLFDKESTVFAIKKENQKSKRAILVKDTALNFALKKTFNDVWENKRSLSFHEFLISKINEYDSFDLINTNKVVEKFNMPIELLNTMRNTFPLYIFLIGRPGSGKSEVAIEIIEYFQNLNFSNNEISYIDDYEILLDWSKDSSIEGVVPFEPDGFKVVDNKIYEKCNKKLKERVEKTNKKISIIEFSRNDYMRFFKKLGAQTIQNSLIVYLNSSVQTCLIRNTVRKHSSNIPTKYVPENVISEYYSDDDNLKIKTEFSNIYSDINAESELSLVKQNTLKKIRKKIEKH